MNKESPTWEERWKLRCEAEKEAADILLRTLTVSSVERVVEIVGIVAEDDETAHGLEDELHQAALRQLSETSDIAKAALKTLGVEFSRWCA